MKLSTFPTFPDLTATAAAPGGIAPSPALEVSSSSTGESPVVETSPADFAAIFGGIVQTAQTGCELPKPIAIGPAVEPTSTSRPFVSHCHSCTVEQDEAEASLEAGATATVVTEPAIPPNHKSEKGRASCHVPERKLPSGVPAEQAAWAHAFATPTAFATTAPLPGCALPPPNASEASHEGVEHSAKSGRADADAMALMFAADPHNAGVSLPRNEVAEERRKTDGPEPRGTNLLSPSPGQTHAALVRANLPHLGRPVEVSARSFPTVVTRSFERSATSFPDELELSPEIGDGSALPPPLEATSSAPAAPGVDVRASAAEPGLDARLSPRDVRPNQSRQEADANFSAMAAAGKTEQSDAEPIGAGRELRQNLDVSFGGIQTRSARTEKVAGAVRRSGPDDQITENRTPKSFLGMDEQELTTDGRPVGTGSAKPRSIVSATTLSHHEPSASATQVASAPAFDLGPDLVTAETASIVSTAQAAVETIRTMAERVASADAQSINLRFSIGESDLRVRVGYRGDEVQTTFVTESPELRAALLQEWQALNSSATADRSSVRFAEPVFSSQGQGNGSNPSFDSASQQHRESAARRDPPSTPEFFRPRVSESLATPVNPAPVRGSAAAGSTQRLHTFA